MQEELVYTNGEEWKVEFFDAREPRDIHKLNALLLKQSVKSNILPHQGFNAYGFINCTDTREECSLLGVYQCLDKFADLLGFEWTSLEARMRESTRAGKEYIRKCMNAPGLRHPSEGYWCQIEPRIDELLR